jgi:hypothetical protein
MDTDHAGRFNLGQEAAQINIAQSRLKWHIGRQRGAALFDPLANLGQHSCHIKRRIGFGHCKYLGRIVGGASLAAASSIRVWPGFVKRMAFSVSGSKVHSTKS